MSAGRSSVVCIAVLGALCASGVVAACKPAPRIDERPIQIYAPKACPVSQLLAYSLVNANGDFEDNESAVSSYYLGDVGIQLIELPSESRSVVVDVSHPATAVDWHGTAEIPASGPVNVLVWPDNATCTLSRDVEFRDDVSLGVFGHHLMVVGGTRVGQVPHTFVGDLSTGIVDRLEFGLGTRRSRATITAFRATPDQDPAPALVAGGEDPDTATQAPLDTAEVYLPKLDAEGQLGDFERARIDLADARTKHGAVVLATGETLLVGGTGSDRALLPTMEIIDPKTRTTRTDGLAKLSVPRINPTVLRLASGEILVAGGLNRSNIAVTTLEWFSADGTKQTKTAELVAGNDRAFVPLGAGGALAVVQPQTGVTNIPTVWVISADGTIDPAHSVDPATLDSVHLYAGSDGAPVLWTGHQWLRWEPWFGAFQPIPNAPSRGPIGTAIANGDSGLALWLDDRQELDASTQLPNGQLYVRGFRFATRSRYGTVPNPLLVDGTAGLAPDCLTGGVGSPIRFVPNSGLQLGPGASAFVTDVTYANVSVEIEAPNAPLIVLRQDGGREIEVGGNGCAFAQNAKASVRVVRHGTTVTVVADETDEHVCPTELDPGARVSIGVRGSSGASMSVARNLRINRL